MTGPLQRPLAMAEDARRVAELLGGPRILRRPVSSSLDAHALILAGLPTSALIHLLAHLPGLARAPAFAAAVGVSPRTLQRRKSAPGKPLSKEQGNLEARGDPRQGDRSVRNAARGRRAFMS